MKQLLHRYFSPLFYSLLVIFFVLYIRTLDFSKLDLTSIHPGYLLLSGLFTLSFRLWGALIWVTILKGLGASQIRLSGDLLFVYVKSWLARYIPGTAPWILSKIYFASQYGISKHKLAVSSLLEAGLQIVSLFALSLFVLAIDARGEIFSPTVKLLMWVGLVCLLITLYPPVFNKILSTIYQLARRQTLAQEDRVTLPVVWKGITLYLVGAVMNGVGLYFIAKAIYPALPIDQLLFVVGSGTLAGALGMIAVFAPSGIGVRDGIQLALLSLIIPSEYALLIVIATRIWDVIIDIIFYGVGAAYKQFDRKVT